MRRIPSQIRSFYHWCMGNGESDLLYKGGGQIGGEPGVPDGVGAKKGEHAPVLGDAADFVHHHPVVDLGQDRPVPGLDDASGSPLDSRGMNTLVTVSLDLSNEVLYDM